MSTKISKGARLHLLRCVERLQYPMFTLRIGRAGSARTMAAMRRIAREALADGAVFVLPPWIEMTFSVV